jgi:hypothetical protein
MSILPKPRHTHVDAISDKEIARALIDNQGLRYLAAEQIGMNYCHMLTRIKQSEYLQAIKEACIERRIDEAEKVLSEMVKGRNFNAVALTLRTLGRSRGYAETDKAVQPAEVIRAFNDTMAIWGQKQAEIQADDISRADTLQEADVDLNSDNTSMSNDL